MTGRRILVTGAAGFVGPYVVTALRCRLDSTDEIYAASRQGGLHPVIGALHQLDVTHAPAVEALIRQLKPTHVIHLAAVAAIPNAAANAQLTWSVHLYGALNVASAILSAAPTACLLHVGSGQVYGPASAASGTSLTEQTLLSPNNTYTASKAAADLAVGAMSGDGLRSIRLRPFNHIGPGQSEDFAISSFAMQIARIKRGVNPPTIRVGNIDVQRDFLDVRDVAEAYVAAVLRSNQLPLSLALNISSGRSYRIRILLEELIRLSGLSITVEVDQQRMRTNDVFRFVGDSSLARTLLGWSPTISITDTLSAVLADADARVELEIAAKRDRPKRALLRNSSQ